MNLASFMGVIFQVKFNMRKAVGYFFHFVADKVTKDFGLEGSDGDITINDIGCQHWCVFYNNDFNLRCTIV